MKVPVGGKCIRQFPYQDLILKKGRRANGRFGVIRVREGRFQAYTKAKPSQLHQSNDAACSLGPGTFHFRAIEAHRATMDCAFQGVEFFALSDALTAVKAGDGFEIPLHYFNGVSGDNLERKLLLWIHE